MTCTLARCLRNGARLRCKDQGHFSWSDLRHARTQLGLSDFKALGGSMNSRAQHVPRSKAEHGRLRAGQRVEVMAVKEKPMKTTPQVCAPKCLN